MKKLIINADDFGYSSAVNIGILQSHKQGVLTSATLMANMPGTLEAIEMAKQVPSLGVGAHLVLTIGRPLLTGVSSIVNSNGDFHCLDSYKEFRKDFSNEEIFIEWCAQIDFLLDEGIKLTHFDSHHHVHSFQENLVIAEQISEKYDLPFRNCQGILEETGILCKHKNDLCIDIMDMNYVRSMEQPYKEIQTLCLKEVEAIFKDVVSYNVVEAMVHPAFVDEHLFFNSSFNIQRMREVEVLTDPKLLGLIQSLNIELAHYGNV